MSIKRWFLLISLGLAQTSTSLAVDIGALKSKFSDVVLVVNFNHPYYSNIDFLKSLYSLCFDKILFYGEAEGNGVVRVATNTGYILSSVIEDACDRFPDCKGYLFLQDDCALHFWNFLSYDLEKIWYAVKFNDGLISNDKFYSLFTLQGSLIGGFDWSKWGYPSGLSAARVAYSQLPEKNLTTIKANLGENIIAANMCEVFYVPARLKKSFIELNNIFKNVFCEIAIPTMLCCMDHLTNWERLSMLGGSGVGYDGLAGATLIHYPIEVSWVHPVKFSSQDNRDRMLEIVKKLIKQ